MMPVMKNNYDIYKDGRSRKTSESSASAQSNNASNNMATAMGIAQSRGRQRMKSESFASSPNHSYRMQMQRCQSQKTFPRNASRTSQYSATSGPLSPTRSFCQPSSSPPKAGSSSNNQTGSQNDISKFHLRLVDKLRKSFRKDSAKRSWKSTGASESKAENICSLPPQTVDRREADSNCSEEPLSSTAAEATTTSTQLSCSSSSNTIKTEIQQQKVQCCDNDNNTSNKVQFLQKHTNKEEAGLLLGPSLQATTTNSCNVTTFSTTTTSISQLELNDLDNPSSPAPPPPPPAPPTQHISLAKQLGRHFQAPLIKANIKRCHRKLANLQLHYYHHHHHHAQQQRSQQLSVVRENSKHKKPLNSSSSTLDLFKQSVEDNSFHYEALGSGERKSLVKNMQTASEVYVDKMKKSPEKCNTSGGGGGLRQARRRKRLHFMRRSTKSAPG